MFSGEKQFRDEYQRRPPTSKSSRRCPLTKIPLATGGRAQKYQQSGKKIILQERLQPRSSLIGFNTRAIAILLTPAEKNPATIEIATMIQP